ncbi:MAG: hypothetical protein IJK54_03970 [Clostridia bacterium]|nr:hypothetical protein [Clostridia bacterium]
MRILRTAGSNRKNRIGRRQRKRSAEFPGGANDLNAIGYCVRKNAFCEAARGVRNTAKTQFEPELYQQVWQIINAQPKIAS